MRSLAFVLVLALAPIARAQEPDAAAVAQSAQRFLTQTTSFDTRFQQDLWMNAQRRTMTSHGRLRGARPDHVRFDYDGGRVTIANGADFVDFEPGDASFPGQITHGSNDAIGAAFGVLVGGAPLDRDHTIGACAGGEPPSGTRCVELRARDAHAPYTRIRLYVRESGEPARLAIETHGGNWNGFTFESFHASPSIETSVFAFTPPAGTRERRFD